MDTVSLPDGPHESLKQAVRLHLQLDRAAGLQVRGLHGIWRAVARGV